MKSGITDTMLLTVKDGYHSLMLPECTKPYVLCPCHFPEKADVNQKGVNQK